MARIIFLGTNGWYDTKTGSTTCILIDAIEYGIILDAGNGIHKLDEYSDLSKPFYLLISHLHLDHISGLHVLAKFQFRKGLDIFLPNGQLDHLKQYLSDNYTMGFDKLPYRVDFFEMPDQADLLPCNVQSFEMVHTVKTLAYRIEIEGRVITYCADTCLHQGAIEAARDTDILIAESFMMPGERSGDWPHLSPDEAAEIADRSGAGKLILTHFDASRYKDMESRHEAAAQVRKIFPNTHAAYDGMTVEVTP